MASVFVIEFNEPEKCASQPRAEIWPRFSPACCTTSWNGSNCAADRDFVQDGKPIITDIKIERMADE